MALRNIIKSDKQEDFISDEEPLKNVKITFFKTPKTMRHVYIIECKDGKLYTGITTDIDRRVTEHNSGYGGRFTRYRKPVKLVYSQQVLNISNALKKEAKIKKLKRSEKLNLIER